MFPQPMRSRCTTCAKCKIEWCKLKKKAVDNDEVYIHNKHFHFPPLIMEAVKQVFKDLANPEFLKKCFKAKLKIRIKV